MRLHRFEFWVEDRQFVLEKFKQAVKLWYVSGSHSVNCSALPILFLYLKTDNVKPHAAQSWVHVSSTLIQMGEL